MANPKFIFVLLLLFAGYLSAQSPGNVEKVSRFQVVQHTAIPGSGLSDGSSSQILIAPDLFDTKSSPQLDELGGRYSFSVVNSSSQLEELGGRYSFSVVNSSSQLEVLGGRYSFSVVNSNSQLEELGGRYSFSVVNSNSQLEELGSRFGGGITH